MAQKAPQAPGNRRTTYQGGGARSTGRGSVVTTQGGGSTVTINPGTQPRKRRSPPAPPGPPGPRPGTVARRQPQVIQGRVVSRRTRPPSSGGRKPPKLPPVKPPPKNPYVKQPAARRAPRIADRTPRNTVTVQNLPSGAYSASRLLTAELIFGVLIVAMRAVADYQPQADGTITGKIGHPKGQYGPLPILAGLIITFFLLSFLAAAGGTKAKLAVIFGGTIDIALLLKSTTELKTVSDVFGTFGKAKVPPGSWQTSGTIAGAPISGNLPGGGTVAPPGAQSGGNPVKPGKDGKCPAGYGLLNGVCVPVIVPGPPLN